MSVEKTIQTITGVVTGLITGIIFFILEFIFFYLTEKISQYELFVFQVINFLFDIVNGIFILVLMYVCLRSIKKNKDKYDIVIANMTIIVLVVGVISFFLFY